MRQQLRDGLTVSAGLKTPAKKIFYNNIIDSNTTLRYPRCMKTPKKGLALLLFVAITASPLYGQTVDTANQPPEQPVGEEAGYGIGSALANVLYIPAKVTYAGLGLLTGGLGYVLSGGRTDVASNIIYPAIRGNYVVTPSHLKGTEPIYFVGAPPATEDSQQAQAPAPQSTIQR